MNYRSLMTPSAGFQLPMDYNPSIMELPQLGMDPAMAALPNIAMPQQQGNPLTGLFDGFLNKTQNGVTQQGWGGMALGAASGLMNGYLGFKQLGIAKDTLAQNKREFDLNFGAQRKMTNSRLADRQATRLASNPNSGMASVDDYMKRYGI